MTDVIPCPDCKKLTTCKLSMVGDQEFISYYCTCGNVPPEFKEGELVWLILCDERQVSLVRQRIISIEDNKLYFPHYDYLLKLSENKVYRTFKEAREVFIKESEAWGYE